MCMAEGKYTVTDQLCTAGYGGGHAAGGSLLGAFFGWQVVSLV